MKEKIIIYQVLPRLFGNRNTTRKENGSIEENGCGKMNDITPKVLRDLSALGVSHIWYTGLLRHATTTDYSHWDIPRQHPAVVKGRAGSPYAITDYYDVDPDLAVDVSERMAELERLIERTHKAGLKVIIDFVPNHVARQYQSVAKPKDTDDLGVGDNPTQSFDPQNNFYYLPGQRFIPYLDLYHGEAEPYLEEPAKATGNDCFHNAPGPCDWYETVKLNYGADYLSGRISHFDPVPSTWNKMLDILLYWAGKGVDGFRCDMAEMVPAEFWSWVTERVKSKFSDCIFIGEVYCPSEYRRYIASGFDYLYDKVGMYDTMFAIVSRGQSAHSITNAWQQTDDIRQHMLYFLENHDELRLASDFFASSPRKGIPALIVLSLMRQNPFMLYFGQEYGERGMDKEGFSGRDGRTTIFDYWSVDTLCRASKRKLTDEEQDIFNKYSSVLNIARSEKAITEGEMYDLMYVNPQLQRQYAFLRCASSAKRNKELVMVVANFDDNEADIDVCIPAHAFDFLGLKEKRSASATDLLSGNKYKISLKRDGCISVSLPAQGGIVLKIS